MGATADGAASWPWQPPAARLFAAAARRRIFEAGGPPPGHRRTQHVRPARGFGFGSSSAAAPWFGGPPFRGSRRSRPGDVRFAVLCLLGEEPMHGYQIISELASRTGGAWQPSPGSIYPTLQQLADEGLVSVAERDGRRTFTLTDAGRTELTRLAADRPAPWEDMAADVDDGLAGLQESAGQVLAAAMQVAAAGHRSQVARAEKLLRDCRRSLYRLLAEDDAGEEET